jgi:ribosomal protein S18 acetylase RimI-like enzyme
MDAGDLAFGVRLKDAAGWNQTEADWQRLLALAPDGCFLAEYPGGARFQRAGHVGNVPHVPVGTAVACVFGRVGWIAMVLVDPAYRGRGIGTRLVEHAIEHLQRQAVRSIRLDATPLGRPVYEKLGFRIEYELVRWQGVAPVRRPQRGVAPAEAGQLEAIAELDQQLTGTPRRLLLNHLFHQQPRAMRVAVGPEGVLGYATWREGSLAAFLGPAMAVVPEAGKELVDSMLAACAERRVFVDVPCDNGPATRWAEACGFTVQRPLTRMVRGEPVADRPDCIWASSGPENG